MGAELIGAMLRARRESLGYTIDQMAQITNIRPRLLETFESSDYDKYPPKGYATGMLSSYARALGMDPRPVLSGFEIEYSNHNQQKEIAAGASNARLGKDRRGFKRGSNPSSRRDSVAKSPSSTTGSMEPIAGDTAGDIARATSAVKVVGKSARTRGRRRITAVGNSRTREENPTSRLDAYRKSMEDRYQSASGESPSITGSLRNSSAATTGRLTALAASTGSFEPVEEERDSISESYELRSGGKRKPRSRGTSGRNSAKSHATPDDQTLPARVLSIVKGVFSERRTRLMVLAGAFVIAALIIIASVLMGTAGNKDAGILDVTGGAGTQSVTENGTDKKSGAAVATVTTANGNPVVVSVDVPEGKTSLVNVVCDNDKAFDGTAVGPWHREFQVTQSLSATFGNPSAVTVEENGTKIDIPAAEDGTGSVRINIQSSDLASQSESGNK